MCIIVAKKAGVKMPSMDTLSNCFTRNPDGAGIMIAYKNKVHGFKGLMSFDAFKSKLARLEKRFGNLDKLSVVMHFRITTHGGTIPENTHPFPLKSSYDALRDLEWTASQGMAHNGIISALSSNPDIKAFNVSDTMVFISHIVAPISKSTNIAVNREVAEGLQLMAGSRLAFLDGKGNLSCVGNFITDDGVMYSNDSYKLYDFSKWRSYYYPKSWYDEELVDCKDDYRFLDYSERDESAKEMNYIQLSDCYYLQSGDEFFLLDEDYALDEDGFVLIWNDQAHDWFEAYNPGTYTIYDDAGNEVFPIA